MTYMAMPQHKNPCLWDHKILNFGRSSLFTITSLSESCPRGQKKIFKEIMHFHCTTYMATPQHYNLSPRVHEIYKFGRPTLGSHYYTLVCLNHAPEWKRRFLKKYINFTPKFPPLGVWGHEIYNFLSPYVTDVTYQIWLRMAK